MQKQESFYYQAPAGAPTYAAAIGRSPGFWITLLIWEVYMEKKGFLGTGTSDWSLSFEGLCLILDWSLLSR